MKKALIISLLVAAMSVMAFVSCEKEDTIEKPTITAVDSLSQTTPVTHNTELSYTGCHSNQRDGYIVSTSYDNGVLLLSIENFYIDCGMDSLSVFSEVDSQTIDVNIREILETTTNCACQIGVNCSIDNIKAGRYELILREDGFVFYQEEITCE